MSKVLTAVAAIFFLGGLASIVGYFAHQTTQWRMHGEFELEHLHLLYLGGAAAAVGMLTLALLEIRVAILLSLEYAPPAEQPSGSAPPPASHSRTKKSWKKSADIQRSFLDTRETN